MIAGSLCECEECKVELCSYTGNLMQNRRYEFCGSRGGMSRVAGTGTKDSDTQMDPEDKNVMRIRGKIYCGLFVIRLDDRNNESPEAVECFRLWTDQ